MGLFTRRTQNRWCTGKLRLPCIPQYDICENVAWDNIPFDNVLRNLVADTQAVCFGSLAQRAKVIREAHEKAVAVSAYVCTQRGAMPELPDELKK